MRTALFFLASILILSALPSTADGQIINRLKNRAKKAAENKVEEKIGNEVEKAAERAVEKSWNSIFGEGFNNSGEGINIPFSLNSNAVTEDSYTFNVVTTMEIESSDGNQRSEEPVIIRMHFNENQMYSGTQISGEQMEESEGEVFIVYDLKNESMVMLMDGDDGKFSFAYDWKQVQDIANKYTEMDQDSGDMDMEMEEENDGEEWEDFKEIGTKTIAGLECRGYMSENEDVKMEFWTTDDDDYGIQKILSSNSQTKVVKGKAPDSYPSGMLMEMTQENLKSGEITKMRITDIDKNAKVTYNMSDYPAMTYGQQ